MIPGTVLFDDRFRFSDGDEGRKLIVVLNEGDCGKYLVVKTTSRNKRYTNKYGCHHNERYPYFYAPKHSSCLNEDTWIQLEEFFWFDKADLVQRVMTNLTPRIGVLSKEMAMELVQCIAQCEDLDQESVEIILAECKSLGS